MAKLKYNVVAITGKYEKDGEQKNRYEKAGVVIEKDGSFRLKMEKPVMLNDEGNVVQWFFLSVPKEKKEPEPESKPDFDDDIPF